MLQCSDVVDSDTLDGRHDDRPAVHDETRRFRAWVGSQPTGSPSIGTVTAAAAAAAAAAL
jgi:hypothetical protein